MLALKQTCPAGKGIERISCIDFTTDFTPLFYSVMLEAFVINFNKQIKIMNIDCAVLSVHDLHGFGLHWLWANKGLFIESYMLEEVISIPHEILIFEHLFFERKCFMPFILLFLLEMYEWVETGCFHPLVIGAMSLHSSLKIVTRNCHFIHTWITEEQHNAKL